MYVILIHLESALAYVHADDKEKEKFEDLHKSIAVCVSLQLPCSSLIMVGL
jgi:hypothetical protein